MRKVNGILILVACGILSFFSLQKAWGTEVVTSLDTINEKGRDTKQFGPDFSEPELNLQPEVPLCPQFDISVNIGYGNVYNRTKGISGAEKRMEDEISSGLTWDIQFHDYFASLYGVGVIYSGYKSSSSSLNNTSYDFLITYLAPMFSAKMLFADRWMLKSEIGFGYLGVKIIADEMYKQTIRTGKTVGYNANLGIEYKLLKHLGVGFDLGIIAGSFGKLKFDNGYRTTLDPRMGVSRIQIQLGVRYYIK